MGRNASRWHTHGVSLALQKREKSEASRGHLTILPVFIKIIIQKSPKSVRMLLKGDGTSRKALYHWVAPDCKQVRSATDKVGVEVWREGELLARLSRKQEEKQ